MTANKEDLVTDADYIYVTRKTPEILLRNHYLCGESKETGKN